MDDDNSHEFVGRSRQLHLRPHLALLPAIYMSPRRPQTWSQQYFFWAMLPVLLSGDLALKSLDENIFRSSQLAHMLSSILAKRAPRTLARSSSLDFSLVSSGVHH